MTTHAEDRLTQLQRYAAAVGLAGVAVCAFGWWWAPGRFFEAYLFAFLVVTGVGLGSLALAMLHQLVGGAWGRATRPVLEATAWPLVITPLLAIPLIFSIDSLYPWADAQLMEDDPLLAKKVAYLNPVSFQIRAAVYLVLWATLTGLVCLRLRSDEAPRRALRRKRLRRLSAFGLVLYVLSVTFAAIDWMMSLEPLWFSAIYGVIVIAGQAAVAFALVICVLVWLRGDERVEATATARILQDLGNLLLAAVTFWMYIAFSQFLIIWAGNLTEEIPWYLARSRGGWQWLAVALVLLHFVVPFVALLSPVVKRSAGYLAGIATLVSLMHVADVYWLVMPALRASLSVHWLDLAALVTLSAVWKVVTAWRLQTAPRFPAEVPQRGLEHGKLTALHQPG